MTETEKSLVPTRKWIANAISVLAGWLIALVSNDWVVSDELAISGIGILAGLLSSWLLANENTPGGVPRKARHG